MNTHEPWEQHPDNYRQDLNSNAGAGLNVGTAGDHPEKSETVKTAYDIKRLHNRLEGYSDDELKGLPIMPPGSRLEQGATYIDLRESEPREFTGLGNMYAEKAIGTCPRAKSIICSGTGS